MYISFTCLSLAKNIDLFVFQFAHLFPIFPKCLSTLVWYACLWIHQLHYMFKQLSVCLICSLSYTTICVHAYVSVCLFTILHNYICTCIHQSVTVHYPVQVLVYVHLHISVCEHVFYHIYLSVFLPVWNVFTFYIFPHLWKLVCIFLNIKGNKIHCQTSIFTCLFY